MSRPRFLADHDFNDLIVQGVLRREPAIEFVRARDVDLQEATDAAILTYAASHKFVVVSHDVSTMTEAAKAKLGANEPMNGLLLVPQRATMRRIIEDLVLIWAATEAEEWLYQVGFLPLK